MRRPATLDMLYADLEACDAGTVRATQWNAHVAILDRLAANQRTAEQRGWTSCALERASTTGRLAAWGLPPGNSRRQRIPDWANRAH